MTDCFKYNKLREGDISFSFYFVFFRNINRKWKNGSQKHKSKSKKLLKKTCVFVHIHIEYYGMQLTCDETRGCLNY